jgi:hypothetical protein
MTLKDHSGFLEYVKAKYIELVDESFASTVGEFHQLISDYGQYISLDWYQRLLATFALAPYNSLASSFPDFDPILGGVSTPDSVTTTILNSATVTKDGAVQKSFETLKGFEESLSEWRGNFTAADMIEGGFGAVLNQAAAQMEVEPIVAMAQKIFHFAKFQIVSYFELKLESSLTRFFRDKHYNKFKKDLEQELTSEEVAEFLQSVNVDSSTVNQPGNSA